MRSVRLKPTAKSSRSLRRRHHHRVRAAAIGERDRRLLGDGASAVGCSSPTRKATVRRGLETGRRRWPRRVRPACARSSGVARRLADLFGAGGHLADRALGAGANAARWRRSRRASGPCRRHRRRRPARGACPASRTSGCARCTPADRLGLRIGREEIGDLVRHAHELFDLLRHRTLLGRVEHCDAAHRRRCRRRSCSCQADGPLVRRTCTAVTLYSGQLVAQSENSVVTTLAPDIGWWKVV